MGETSPLQQAATIHGAITTAVKQAQLGIIPKPQQQQLVAFIAHRHFGAPMMVSERHEGNGGLTPTVASRIGDKFFDLSDPSGPIMPNLKGVNMTPAAALEVLSPQRNPGMEARYLKVAPHLQARTAQPA